VQNFNGLNIPEIALARGSRERPTPAVEQPLRPVDIWSQACLVFDEPQDRVLCAGFVAGPAVTRGGHLLRFDAAHKPHGVQALGDNAGANRQRIAGLLQAQRMLCGDSWIVVVADAQAVGDLGPAELDSLLAGLPRVLLLWCGVMQQAESDHWGPGLPSTESYRVDRHSLELTLQTIRRRGKSAIVQIAVQAGLDPSTDHEVAPAEVARQSLSSGAAAVALQLVEMAKQDARIVCVDLLDRPLFGDRMHGADGRFFNASDSPADSLVWCAGLAAGGCHPFVFMDAAALTRCWGTLVDEVCQEFNAVTLLLEDDGSLDCAAPTLHSLSLIPNTVVLAPRSQAELDAMLGWALEQRGPAAIVLPPRGMLAAGAELQRPIELGRAERVGQGRDVVFVTLGSVSEVALCAVQVLAERGVQASVINARFASPLDADGITACVASAASAVILTHGRADNDFASRVLGMLAERGSRTPISTLSLSTPADGPSLHDRHNQSILRVVEHCRWLSDPIREPATLRTEPFRDGDFGAQPSWISFQGSPAADRPDEQSIIHGQQLSCVVEEWVRAYSEFGSRNLYLWKWCLHGLKLTTLPCVDPALADHLCDTKLLAVMFGVLLDDVADQLGDWDYLRELLGMIRGGTLGDVSKISREQQTHAEFTYSLWQTIHERLRSYPLFGVHEELLDYDHQQIFNTMQYSCLVNRQLYMLNLPEHDMYLPHNMQMMSFATMDLMCSPNFQQHELGALREAVWHSQCMGRIGNLVSTWQREIGDRDFTSAVFARALRQGDVTLEDLRSGEPALIEAAVKRGGHETYFLATWERHRRGIQELGPHVSSIDLGEMVQALDRLIFMELGSRGCK